jgi:hypothetical protein
MIKALENETLYLVEIRSAGGCGRGEPHVAETWVYAEGYGHQLRIVSRPRSGRREVKRTDDSSIERYVARAIDITPIGVSDEE